MDWLNIQSDNRGWSIAELARRAGVSSSALYLISSGRRKPGPELCIGLATALRMPVDIVFREAGILPPEFNPAPPISELDYIASQLSPYDKETLLDIARSMLGRYERTKRDSEET